MILRTICLLLMLNSVFELQAQNTEVSHHAIPSWRKLFRVGVGFGYGNSILFSTETGRSNRPHFPTRTFFCSLETPHRRVYGSLRMGYLTFNPSVSGYVETFADVEGQGIPSSIYTTGYRYSYAELTSDFWASSHLMLSIGKHRRKLYFTTGIGGGILKNISFVVQSNEKIAFEHDYGSTYGPAPMYEIYYFDNIKYWTYKYIEHPEQNRNRINPFIEICLRLNYQPSPRIALSIEGTSRASRFHNPSSLTKVGPKSFRYFSMQLSYTLGKIKTP